MRFFLLSTLASTLGRDFKFEALHYRSFYTLPWMSSKSALFSASCWACQRFDCSMAKANGDGVFMDIKATRDYFTFKGGG
jgi:hypothetical protein